MDAEFPDLIRTLYRGRYVGVRQASATVLLGTAVWRRRHALAIAAGLLAVVHVALLWPAVGSRPPPAWASSAPRITVLSANVYDGNQTPAAAASMLVGAPADVLVLVEITRALLRTRRLTDTQYAEAATELGEPQLIELVALAGHYSLIGLTLGAFEVRHPDDLPTNYMF